MTRTFELSGISLRVPQGWEARGVAPAPGGAGGETAYPYLHAATFALRSDRAPFGGGTVETMGDGDAFLALVEFTPSGVGTRLFAERGVPRRLRAASFSPASLQRTIRGQLGLQRFFHDAGRALCLYVVLGSRGALARALPEVNALLASVAVAGRAAP